LATTLTDAADERDKVRAEISIADLRLGGGGRLALMSGG